MRRLFLFAAASLVVLWAGGLWINQGRWPAAAPVAAPLHAESSRPPAFERRFATPRQLTASGTRTGQSVSPFTAVAQDGRRLGLAELSDGRPLVLIFIKRGCPCSVEFEPIFHRLEQAYRDCARFAGVIDGPVAVARDYAEANRVPYPVLADSAQQLIDEFRAENGGYVALVTPDGMLDTLWPGCSVEMMQELSHRIAASAGVPDRPVDPTGLPHALTTGCPFNGPR